MNRHLALAAVVLIALVGFGLNADAAKSLTIDGINLGTHVTGPQVSAADLKGKVVVFEYWGDRCPPCLGSIPHVTGLAAKYGDKVQFVANQVWTKNVDAAAKAWKGRAKNDLVSVINHGAIQGANVRGVPHAFVFNANGQLVWDGHPMNGLDKAIDKALAQGSV